MTTEVVVREVESLLVANQTEIDFVTAVVSRGGKDAREARATLGQLESDRGDLLSELEMLRSMQRR